MAPVKRFAKYSEDLQKVIALLEDSETLGKNVKKALTIIKRVEKSAAKYAGTGDDNTSKKPRKLNNYMLFVMENRAKVVAEMGKGAKPTEVTRRLGAMWQEQKESWAPKKGSVATKKAPAPAPAKGKGKGAKKGGDGNDSAEDLY